MAVLDQKKVLSAPAIYWNGRQIKIVPNSFEYSDGGEAKVRAVSSGPNVSLVVGVNVDQKTDDAKAFLKDTPASFDVAFDPSGKTPKTYAIKGMPTSVLIGADGKVISVHSGFKPEQRAELEAQIQQALALQK